jgi:signal transduction histidine kinase
MGLGLYITCLITQAHGGRVWVESELGQGSTFFLAIPMGGPPGSAETTR